MFSCDPSPCYDKSERLWSHARRDTKSDNRRQEEAGPADAHRGRKRRTGKLGGSRGHIEVGLKIRNDRRVQLCPAQLLSRMVTRAGWARVHPTV